MEEAVANDPMELQAEEEEEGDDEEMNSDDESDDYSSGYTSEEDMGYGNLLQNALMIPAGGPAMAPYPVDTRTPLERWRHYVAKIRTRQTKVLKFVDVQLHGELAALSNFSPVVSLTNDNNDSNNNNNNNVPIMGGGGEEQTNGTGWYSELLDAVTTAAVNPGDSSTTGQLTHAIIGTHMLRLLGHEGQTRLLLAIASHKTLAFLQLKGITDPPTTAQNNNNSTTTVLSMPAVIGALDAYGTPALNELELMGAAFPSLASIRQWSAILKQKRGSLRQVNLVGIEPPPTGVEVGMASLAAGWLDPILLALAAPNAETATPLDELKLVGAGTQQPTRNTTAKSLPSITPQALSTLLQHKKKWWRLSLDGMGLQDEHLHVLTTMFRRDDACKAGDLLSLERNQGISSRAYEEFFEGCFFWKRRMGLIKVDDKDWEGQFDLVRSMNNLHNRLDFVVSTRHNTVTAANNNGHYKSKCSFASRTLWVEWLAKLGTGLAWEDDKHRINYLWFTLLEKPEFIYSHE
ncbi:expressed unknown protein [Seminavis robusta]|uniref:Uncharacterized protein n=1 Tax=Seminavis robusta TaxID=568900 RepID=A0A9N8DIW3_9STRA|nr:expressed unknown protein [Seminavis robusta]|eukprot:Sro152_g069400.1 n/a (518) ;mRNA; r:30850-32403